MKKTILFFLLLPLLGFSQWLDVGGGVYHTQSIYGGINAMSLYNGKLWCVGGFDVAGNITGVVSIATWNGSQWEKILPGNDDNGGILAFEKYIDGKLYIAGSIHNTGGWIWGNQISRWNGNSWENFTPGAYGTQEIRSLSSYKNKLYAAGTFVAISGVNVNHIASWDSITGWQDVGGGIPGNIAIVSDLEIYNDELYAAGNFYGAGNKVAWCVARWNGTEWNKVGKRGISGNGLRSMAVDTLRNFLYVAGAPNWADGDTGTNVVQWDGKRWSFICHYNMMGNQIAMYHNELYLSGIDPIVLTNGDTLFGVAKWDGKNWKPVGRLSVWGTGDDGCGGPLIVYNDTLYFGGRCDSADNIAIHNIARLYTPPDTSCNVLLNNFNKIWAKDTTYFCDTIMAVFDNNTSYADSWLWDFGDGTSNTLSESIHEYANSGTYDVSLITSYKYCKDTAYKTITVFPCDSLKLYIYGQPDTIYMQQDGNGIWYAYPLFFSSTPHADYWWWDFGNGFKDSSDVFYYRRGLFKTPGTFTIMLIVTNGCCVDTVYKTITVIKPTSIVDIINSNIEFIGQNIPNPFKNTTSIPYYLPYGSSGNIEITDISGKVLKKYPLQQGKNKLDVSLESFKHGTYLYSIRIDGVVKQSKKMMME